MERNGGFRPVAAVCVLILALCALAQAQYGGGTGTAEDPYVIATTADLILLGESPEDYDKHFTLAGDIDLDPNLPGGRVFGEAVISPRSLDRFSGVFDGDGHVVSHLTIRAEGACVGLFGRLATAGIVKNLRVEVVDIVSSTDYVGALAGSSVGTIANCWGTGTLSGVDYTGGLVGYNSGSIADCQSMGTVIGVDYVGGLAGRSMSGELRDCYSTSEVCGHSKVGGLVGHNTGDVTDCHSSGPVDSNGYEAGGLIGTNADGTISHSFTTSDVNAHHWAGGLVGEHIGTVIVDCHATGTVIGEKATGGLVGINRSTVSHCYASGNVTGDEAVGGLVAVNYDLVTHCWSSGAIVGDEYVGGLVGYNPWHAISNSCSTGAVRGRESVGGLAGLCGGTLLSSYSTGPVAGEDKVGGLVGNDVHGVISNCYSTGAIDGISDQVGGLVGKASGTVSESFWDVNTSGQPTSAAGEGLTTAQMQDRQTFTGAKWDFVGEQNDGLCEIWEMPTDGRYPVLASFNGYVPADANGDGSPEVPYQVGNPEDLSLIYHHPTGHFRLVSDIDLSGRVLSTAAIPVFAGRLDGDRRRIANMKISGGGSLSLFGYLGRNGVVLNLGVTDADVYGTGDWVGILVGFNEGTVSGCHVDGTVHGSQHVGLLMGENRGMVSCCRSTGSVDGYEDVGGLVGHNWGEISNCYNMGSVSGWKGGLAGLVADNDLEGVISNSYSTGSVGGRGFGQGLLGFISLGAVEGCFWDMQTSNQTISDGGKGLTTAEMMTAVTFLEAGWDFVGEVENGVEEIWWIEEGADYPRLAWEIADAEF